MALRVLLGDESSTIKKVFQLALQDFAVDVRPVNIGVDVASVAMSFKPDIIFADVLLQKKNGYEVALELKQNPQLKNIPVVLMWSGFMELDEDKFGASLANAQLEKPFDVAALRKLVTDLVPRTQNQRLSQFLSFPPMPPIEEPKAPAPAEQVAQEAPSEEDFKQVPIPKMKSQQAEKFRLNLKPEEMDPEHLPVDYEMPSEKVNVDEIFKSADAKGEDDEEEFEFREATATNVKKPNLAPEEADLELDEELMDDPVTTVGAMPKAPVAAKAATPTPTAPTLTEAQLEKIIRAQSAEMLESVIWKVVPDLAKQIIERELKRLLQERDNHP